MQAISTLYLAELIYNRMSLPIRMRTIYNEKHRHAIRLKFGEKFLTYLTKLVLKVKASICSAIKEKIFTMLLFSACQNCIFIRMYVFTRSILPLSTFTRFYKI